MLGDTSTKEEKISCKHFRILTIAVAAGAVAVVKLQNANIFFFSLEDD